MRREHRQLAHFGAPLLFLLAVTVVVLILRGGFSDGSQSPPGSSSTKKTTTTTVSTTQVAKAKTYTVQTDDTLGAIAMHFHVTVDDIVALNPGIEPTALRVGQKIKVGKAPAGG